MEKIAEQRAAAAAGMAVPEPPRVRHGAQCFGDMPFARYRGRGQVALIRERDLDAIADALFDRSGCEPAGKRGRGALYRFRLENGFGILRECRRGGLVRFLLPDVYLLHNRPYRELRVHALLYDRGLSVPEPLGVVWRRAGRVFYRGAVATREIEGCDLLEYLRGNPPDADDTLRRAGRLIRDMHDLGAYHADLQVRNVLVGRDGRLYLIDFDKARHLPRVSPRRRACNLLRFRRSLEKSGLPASCHALVLEGYGGLDLSHGLDLLYRLKGLGSDALSGRTFRAGRS